MLAGPCRRIRAPGPDSYSSKLTRRAVQNGATTLAETFLFMVGAGLVLGETYRSSRKENKRRDDVKDRIESLEEELTTFRETLGEQGSLQRTLEEMRNQ